MVIIQSAPDIRPQWVTDCLNGVEAWSTRHDCDYLLVGDSLFSALEDPLRKKLAGRMPIMADLARLYWIRDLHRQGHDWVLWLDADTLVVDPGWFPQLVGHTQFGEECWIQRRTSGQLETRYQPHNAYILMHRTSPVRDFLIYAVESILHRVDATKLAPQLVGPKLLKALSNLVAFPLEPAAGAMSPILQYALAARDEPEVLDQWPQGRPLALANLCASLDVPAATRAALIAEPQIISERLMNML